MPVVTIRGKLGSAAPEVGREIARLLTVDYVDREIIADVAARLQRREPDVVAKESPSTGLRGKIAEALAHSYGVGGFEGAYLPSWETPLDDATYLRALRSLILELASSNAIVIYGRGSQFILRGSVPAFHVLTVAPPEVRLRRVMDILKLDEEAAKRETARFDSSGREFNRRYFRADWEDPLNYDMVINTEFLSVPDAASVVVDAVRLKEARKNS